MSSSICIKTLIIFNLFILLTDATDDVKNKQRFRMFTNTEEVLKEYEIGYEIIEVISNNYTLKIFHIFTLSEHKDKQRPVVYFQHGFTSSSTSWILLGEDSLPFMLAREGFEIWIGNTRGNFYGNLHKDFFPSEYGFWNFGLDEMADDLKVILNKIIEINENKRIFYVGHSMGTTLFYIYCSTNPVTCNKNIYAMVSLAPTAYMSNTYAAVKIFAKFSGTLKIFFDTFFNGKVPKSGLTLLRLSRNYFKTIKEKLLSVITCLLPKSKGGKLASPQVKMDCTPADGSINTFIHFAQISVADRFQKFDYGKSRNTELYGDETPPEYELEAIKVPIALHYSRGDFLCPYEDVQLLRERLKDTIYVNHVIEDQKFVHDNFLFDKTAKKFVYDKVLNFIVKMEKGVFQRPTRININSEEDISPSCEIKDKQILYIDDEKNNNGDLDINKNDPFADIKELEIEDE